MNDNTTNAFPTAVLAVSGISCALSIFGGFCILLSCILIPEIRNFTRKLLLFLTISDVMTAAGYLLSIIRYSTTSINPSEFGALCNIQSFMTTFSSMSSFLWTIVIAVHLHLTVIYRSTYAEREVWLVIFHVVCWLIPGFITVSAVGYGKLGEDTSHTAGTGPWCWIHTNSSNANKETVLWMFLAGKGWEFLCYLLTATLYIHLKFYLYLRHRFHSLNTVHQDLRDEDKNFMYVWLILYLLRMWGSIRFLVYVIYGSNISQHIATAMDVLLYFQAIGDAGQGFSNFLLFCIADGTVREKLIYGCRRRCTASVALLPIAEDQPITHSGENQGVTGGRSLSGYGSTDSYRLDGASYSQISNSESTNS